MPRRDHFHGRDSRVWPWTSIHATWTTMIALHLNSTVLPAQYRALPEVHIGRHGQIDVSALQEQDQEQGESPNGSDGGVATAVWSPPRTAVTAVVDYPESDIFEIRVYTDTPERRLVSAIELVSPANKDRPSHRQAFVVKCASYLHEGVGLVIVDVVTERSENLHTELLELLDARIAAKDAFAANLYAVAYRPLDEEPPRLQIWPEGLPVGAPLPTIPLWLGREIPVPLDLEATCLMACQGLRLK